MTALFGHEQAKQLQEKYAQCASSSPESINREAGCLLQQLGKSEIFRIVGVKPKQLVDEGASGGAPVRIVV